MGDRHPHEKAAPPASVRERIAWAYARWHDARVLWERYPLMDLYRLAMIARETELYEAAGI